MPRALQREPVPDDEDEEAAAEPPAQEPSEAAAQDVNGETPAERSHAALADLNDRLQLLGRCLSNYAPRLWVPAADTQHEVEREQRIYADLNAQRALANSPDLALDTKPGEAEQSEVVRWGMRGARRVRCAPFSHEQAYVAISRVHEANECGAFVDDACCVERDGRRCAVLGSVAYAELLGALDASASAAGESAASAAPAAPPLAMDACDVCDDVELPRQRRRISRSRLADLIDQLDGAAEAKRMRACE